MKGLFEKIYAIFAVLLPLTIVIILIILSIIAFVKYGGKPITEVPSWALMFLIRK